MPRPQPTMIAGGNIYPARFLKVSTAADFTVLQATDGTSSGGDIVIAVSQQGTNYPPIVDAAITIAGYAAVAGQSIELFGDGDIAPVEAGASFGAGALLKSGSDGRALPALTTGAVVQIEREATA